MIDHYINVYQRPVQGTGFLKRYKAYNYQHTINIMGWFDTASCDVAVRSKSEGFDLINNYLGSLVAILVDNPLAPIWEGIITRITYNDGGGSYTISLDEMANRVSVVYTAAANVATEVAATDNLLSQAIYGVKQVQIEFGGDPSAASQRNNLRNTILSQKAFPQSSFTQAQGNANIVSLELSGVYHTLEWANLFSATTAATSPFSTVLFNTYAAAPNGAAFFNITDSSQVQTNALTSPQQQRGMSYWERIQKIAEAGDSTNYWLTGIMPTNPNTKQRLVYYKQSNVAIDYICYQRDGLKPRNQWGKPIAPWLVTPDHGIRVDDSAIGFSDVGQNGLFDPRTAYIQSVQYDANSQRVQWFAADDTTARAAFGLKSFVKPFSKDFGAPMRIIVT